MEDNKKSTKVCESLVIIYRKAKQKLFATADE